jgi:hypothetical protein
LVWGELGVKERKFCIGLGGPAALEVRDRYGEPIVMLGRVALWLGKDSVQTRFSEVMRVD